MLKLCVCVCVCVFQLLSAMVAKLGNMDDPLPQESFEGVDEDEWVSEHNGNFSTFLFLLLMLCSYINDRHPATQHTEHPTVMTLC